jgi:hypothetical protein
MALGLTQRPDGYGWTVLNDRFLVLPAKGAPVFIVRAGPNASSADEQTAAALRTFDAPDAAAAAIEAATARKPR